MTNIVRLYRPSDREGLEAVVSTMSIGITSLYHLDDHLKQAIVFVLENTETGAIVGTSAINPRTAVRKPTYNYFIEGDFLKLVTHRNGPSEMCGLFLSSGMRGSHLGRLLSHARFLYIANQPEQFAETIFAEMRAYFDKNEENPFWDATGRKTLDITFREALKIEKDFVPKKESIYVLDLPKKAQEIIGQPHPHAVPAMQLLFNLGFQYSGEVDVIGAGPKIWAVTEEIGPIEESLVLPLVGFTEETSETDALINTVKGEFRAVAAPLFLEEKGIVIQKKIADALQVKAGDLLRYITI